MTRFPDTIIVLDAARTVYIYTWPHTITKLSNEIINNITYIHICVLKCVCFRPFPFTESTTATLSRSRTYIYLCTPNRNPAEWPQLSVHARIHARISFFRHNTMYTV